MALARVDVQEADVAVVVCLEGNAAQHVCDSVVDAAGEESVGEQEVDRGHVDESKSWLPGKEANSATKSEGGLYRGRAALHHTYIYVYIYMYIRRIPGG